MVFRTWVALGGMLAAPLSCQREPEREPVMQPAFANSQLDSGAPLQEPVAPPPVPSGRIQTEQAVLVLAGARCDHEATCEAFGSGRRYQTRADCERAASSETQQDIALVGCEKGINPETFQICLSEVRDEACDQALDTLQRIMACSARPLCSE